MPRSSRPNGPALERIRVYAQQQGAAAGFAAGEVLAHPTAFGTRDLMGLLFEGN